MEAIKKAEAPRQGNASPITTDADANRKRSRKAAIEQRRKNCIYWLVVDDCSGPLSLVKTTGYKSEVIAGSIRGAQGFKSGKPDTFISEPWYFETLTDKCFDPIVGEWIDKLGPVENSSHRLQKLREREAKQNRSQAKREHAKELNTTELADIGKLLGNGVSQNYIAEKYGISKSFVHRLGVMNRQIVCKVRGSDSEIPEAAEIEVLQRSEMARAGGVYDTES